MTMKRILINIFIILFICTTSVRGQFIESFGLKGGLSLNNQNIRITPLDYRLETDPVICPDITLFLEAYKRNHQSIELDVSYLVKGFSSSVSSITVNHLENDRIEVNEGPEYISKFHYLSVSPMGRFFLEKDLIGIYGLLGPRLDILLRYITDSDYPLEEQNRLILGINAAAGIEFQLNRITLLGEIRYQPDVTTVQNNEPMHIKNHGVIFLIGIRKKQLQ